MKRTLILSILLCFQFNFATTQGGHIGDGGGECIESFSDTLNYSLDQLNKIQDQVISEWDINIKEVIKKFQSITVVPVDEIVNCQKKGKTILTACSYNDLDQIHINCNEDDSKSWPNELKKNEKLSRTLPLHEILWWFKETVNDSKFYYSNSMIDLLPITYKPSWWLGNITKSLENEIIISGVFMRESDGYGISSEDKSLNALCQKFGYQLSNLIKADTVTTQRLTFVDNGRVGELLNTAQGMEIMSCYNN